MVVGAVQAPIASLTDMASVLGQAHKARSTASTAMNAHSSRSHSVLMLHISGEHAPTSTCLRGSLSLVDLAGRYAALLQAGFAAAVLVQPLHTWCLLTFVFLILTSALAVMCPACCSLCLAVTKPLAAAIRHKLISKAEFSLAAVSAWRGLGWRGSVQRRPA